MQQRWIQGDETDKLASTPNRNISQDEHGKLWFWDESATSAFGPFDTLRDCLHGIEAYVKHLNGGSR